MARRSNPLRVLAWCRASGTSFQTGDYNGDGKSDILWEDNSSNLAVWYMNGAQSPRQQVSVTLRVGPFYRPTPNDAFPV